MTTAPSRPAHERRRAQRFLMSVDCRFNGVDYRIHERARERGAQIRTVDQPMGCFSCPRILKLGTPQYMPMSRCIPCAIRGGFLIPVGKSFETEDPR